MMLTDWPNDDCVQMYQSLLQFFASPPSALMALVSDFDPPRGFDTYDGCIETPFPLYICNHAMVYWAGLLRNNEYPGIDLNDCSEVFELAMTIDQMTTMGNEYWKKDFWMTSNFQEAGLWSVMRRVCAQALTNLPPLGPLTRLEIENLWSLI